MSDGLIDKQQLTRELLEEKMNRQTFESIFHKKAGRHGNTEGNIRLSNLACRVKEMR